MNTVALPQHGFYHLEITKKTIWLVTAWVGLAGSAPAEILVYGTKPKTWSAYHIEEGVQHRNPGSVGDPSIEEGFFFWTLDGIDRIFDDEELDLPEVTHRGQQFFPSTVYLNHKQKTKRVKGALVSGGNPNSHSRTYYGRAVAPGGKRIFKALYQQWEDPRLDGKPTDTGIGILEGVCKLINVGGGQTGYYPPKVTLEIWRVDGSFAGSIGSFQDGRQIKYSNWPMVLYEALTREINDRGLNKSEAVIFAVGYLFPNYTELDPVIDD